MKYPHLELVGKIGEEIVETKCKHPDFTKGCPEASEGNKN